VADNTAPPAQAEVPVEQALRAAMALHRGGEMADAETLYRRIVETFPEHAEALHFLGLLVRQRGRYDEAIELMRRAITVAPGYASAYNNLGNLLCERGNFPEARDCIQRALELEPDDPRALNNLGNVERVLGFPARALATFDRAIALAPDFGIPYENRARCYYRLGDIPRAHGDFCHAVVLDPSLCYSKQFMGIALAYLGRFEDARAYYRRWIEAEPENPVPRHLLSTVLPEPAPPRASNDYIKTTFDGFAGTFDVHLQRLEYRAPELVVAALQESGLAEGGGLDVLDAGCGTGLCGALLRPYARQLHGVDLSSGMLEKARAGSRYDELAEAELTAFMGTHPAAYDVIASSDTLCYFGDLTAVVVTAAAALRPEGRFVFSVESAETEEAIDGYCLRHSGRYAHTQKYVSEIVEGSGLRACSIQRQVLRMESGKPVGGLIVVAIRPRTA